MAITKDYLYNSDAATSCSNVAAWLHENAVPTYFDSVTVSDDGLSVSCLVGDVELLKYKPSTTTGTFIITASSGASKSIGCSSITYAFVNYAYKCVNGIAFTPHAASSSDYFPVIIIKNNKGETTVVSTSYFYHNTFSNISTVAVSAVSLSCVEPLKTFSFTRVDYNLTTLVPFPCNNALGSPTYTPNAFWMPHSQNTAVGKLLINGVAYLSNGYWCIKDE